jgi:hypothetical protein
MSQSGILNVENSNPQIPTSFQTDSGIAIPIANQLELLGEVVANAGIPFRSIGSGNTVTYQVQYAEESLVSDATLVGVAAFDSSAFTVDANGFVTLNGGGGATTNMDVDDFLAPGTDPVVPDGSGNIVFTGGQVAAGTVGANVIRSYSGAANTVAMQIQRSTSSAVTDSTKNGVSHFNSAEFLVDANGFVTLVGTGAGQTITGDSGGALSPTGGNWNILGGPGVTTSGSGSTLTINSVVFTDTTATTLAVDNGYFATAAGTYNLPASAAQGEVIEIVVDVAGVVVLDAPALNFIKIGNALTSSGGTATSSGLSGDALKLRYRASSLTWESISVNGNWITA